MDEKGLEQAPTLSYEAGELVRISGDDYPEILGSDPLLRRGDHLPADSPSGRKR